MYCSNCGIEINNEANFCEVCGTKVTVHDYQLKNKDSERPIDTSPKLLKNSFKAKNETKETRSTPMKIAIFIGIIAILGLLESRKEKSYNESNSTSYNISTDKQLACYWLGYKYGTCAGQAMFNEPCSPSDDIVIPSRCRGKDETLKGITEGTKNVYRIHKKPWPKH